MQFKYIAIAALANIVLAQEPLIINTPPSVVECQPALILFSGGTPPYFLAALPAGQVSAVPLLNFPEQMEGGNYTWIVDLPAGTNFTLSIRDGTGILNYAAPTVIQPGTDSACLNATAASAVSSLGATAPISMSAPASSEAPTSSERTSSTRSSSGGSSRSSSRSSA